MKKLLVLGLLLSSLSSFHSCTKAPDEPEPVIDNTNNNPNNNNTNNNNNNNNTTTLDPATIKITSPSTFYAKVDGKVHARVQGKESVQNGTGASKSLFPYPDTSSAEYSAYIYKDVSPEIMYFTLTKGTMSFTGNRPSEENFKAFFNPGAYPYKMDNSSATNGIEILYFENNQIFSSAGGDQTGSTFIIQEMKEEVSQLGTVYIKTLSKFNCKVYDENGNVRQLTDGVAVSLFEND